MFRRVPAAGITVALAALLLGHPAAATASGPSAAARLALSAAPTPMPPGGSYVPVAQQRVLDTRATPSSGSPRVDLTSLVGAGATAAVVTITVLRPAKSGHLTAFPEGAGVPKAQSLVFTAGRSATTTAIITLGDTETFLLYRSSPVDVLVDLDGYFSARRQATDAGSYHSVAPRRFIDTRHGIGAHPLAAGGTESISVTGLGGVPSTGVNAVALNLITVGSTTSGYLSAYPDGQSRPRTTSLTFGRAAVVSSRVIVAAPNGKIAIYNAAGTTQFVAELTGYFGGAGGAFYHPLEPDPAFDDSTLRIADTGGLQIPGPFMRDGILNMPWLGGTNRIDDLAPWSSTIPPVAIVANVTAYKVSGAGHLTGYPSGSAPAVTDLTYAAGVPVNNLFMTPMYRNSFLVGQGASTAQFAIDVNGYFVHDVAASAPGLWGWGQNGDGFGRVGMLQSSAPITIPAPGPIIALSSNGWYANYLIRSDHTVWGWGGGAFGRPQHQYWTPVQVPGVTAAVQVASNSLDDGGWGTAYALRSDGSVLAWGANSRGQLGNGNTTDRMAVGVVPGLTGVVAIAAGYRSGYALKADGTVWAWGDNSTGELGQGTATGYSATPVRVPGLTAITAISADQQEAWAVHADGSLSQWNVQHGRPSTVAVDAELARRKLPREEGRRRRPGWPDSLRGRDRVVVERPVPRREPGAGQGRHDRGTDRRDGHLPERVGVDGAQGGRDAVALGRKPL